MNKKSTLSLCLVVLIGIGFWFYFSNQKNPEAIQQTDEMSIRAVVVNFGETLKNVSLLSPTAPEDIKT